MGEVLERVITQTSQEAMDKEGLRPATQPQIEIKNFDEGADLQYAMSLEVLPEVPAIDLKAIKIERPKAEVKETDLEEVIEKNHGRGHRPQTCRPRSKKRRQRTH